MNTMWVKKLYITAPMAALLVALPIHAANVKPLPALNGASLDALMKSATDLQKNALDLQKQVLAHPDVQKVLKDKDLAKILKNTKIPTNEAEALNMSEKMLQMAYKNGKMSKAKYTNLMNEIHHAREKLNKKAPQKAKKSSILPAKNTGVNPKEKISTNAIAGAKAQAITALKQAMQSPALTPTQKAELAKKLKELQSK